MDQPWWKTLGLDFAAEALPAVLTRAVEGFVGCRPCWSSSSVASWSVAKSGGCGPSLRLSGLLTGQTLKRNFDFAFQPAVQRSKLETLRTCTWLREKQVLLILGPPGGCKTHLAIGLGVRAVENPAFAVAFFRLEELLHAMRSDADVPTGPSQGQEVHEGGSGDHRRGGFRDLHPRGGESVFPAGELSLPAWFAVHHLEQVDQGLAGDVGRR